MVVGALIGVYNIFTIVADVTTGVTILHLRAGEDDDH